MTTAKEVMEKRVALKKRLGDFFRSDAGKELIEDLHEAFDPDELRADSVEDTFFNLGARSVVRYIKSLRDDDKKEK